jgi:hypothetical protein
MFPSQVRASRDAPELLISGVNARKLGSRVTKGAWAGMPIFSLTLEERATCPRSCDLWQKCFGNAMHLAKRVAADRDLIPLLADELRRLQRRHARGFVVRLHQLGDFFSVAYVRQWAAWLTEFPALRIFGYTHWGVETPIGAEVARIREFWWDRFAVRTSIESGSRGISRARGPSDENPSSSRPGAGALMRSGNDERPHPYPAATTIWRLPEGPRVAEGLVCPAQTEKTQACGTCGLCWAEAARNETIVFVGHGMKGGRTANYGRSIVDELIRRVGAGERQAEVAADLGLTTGQAAGIMYRKAP